MKIIIKMFVLITSFLHFFCIFAYSAEDSNLSIEGYIWANTCEIEVDNRSFTIDMGSNSNNNYLDVGRSGPKKYFAINFSNCGETTIGAKVSINGIQDPINNDLLKVNGVSGIAILIASEDYTLIPINTNNVITINLSPGKESRAIFSAQIHSVSLPVSLGTFSSTADIVFEYL